MNMMRRVKKVFWMIVAAIVSIMATVTNALQTVRVTLMMVLELPHKALMAAAIFMGSVFSIACFFMESGFLMALLTAAFGCVIVYIAYRVFAFLYTIVYAALGFILVAFDFEKATSSLTNLLQKAIYAYMDNFKEGDPTKKDRLLFAVPYIIHKLNRLFDKLNTLISYAMYPTSGVFGFILSYQWIFGEYDTAGYKVSDYIISWAVIIIISSVFVYLGHCLADAIRTAAYAARPLDDLFAAYSEFFKNMAGSESTQKTRSKSNKRTEQTQSYANSEDTERNPYYHILAAAETLSDLKKLYKNYAKRLHPDVCEEFTLDESTRRMAQLNAAYEKLKERFV